MVFEVGPKTLLTYYYGTINAIIVLLTLLTLFVQTPPPTCITHQLFVRERRGRGEGEERERRRRGEGEEREKGGRGEREERERRARGEGEERERGGKGEGEERKR